MRTARLAAAPLALILLNLSPLPAEASHTSLDCTSGLDVTISPGLSALPSKGSVTTGESPGLMECTGVLRGQEVGGPGSLSLRGTYGETSDAGDTCHLEGGRGRYSLTLPTTGGAVREEGTFAEVLGPTREGAISAVSDDGETKWTGRFDFLPMQGDCLLTPITAARFTVRLEGRHGGDRPATVGFEHPGGAVAEPGPLPRVANRQFLDGMRAAVGAEGDGAAHTVGDEGVVALRQEQRREVGVVGEPGATQDQTTDPEDRLGDLPLAAVVAVSAQVSPPIWSILARIGAAALLVAEKSGS